MIILKDNLGSARCPRYNYMLPQISVLMPSVYHCVGTNYNLNCHGRMKKGTSNVNLYSSQGKSKCFCSTHLKF